MGGLKIDSVAEEVGIIAVTLGKSENMRVSAGRKFAALWEFVTTPGTDGAQQTISAGYEPTQQGLWEMIVNHPSYPVKLGTSFRTGQRLLSIGRAADHTAEAHHQNNADAERMREARNVTQDAERSACNVTNSAPSCEQPTSTKSGASLEAVVAAVKLLSLPDFERFKVWLRGYCGA
jgi:hypothetical protein